MNDTEQLDGEFNLKLQELLTEYGKEFTPPLDGKDLYNLASDIWDAHCDSTAKAQLQLLDELIEAIKKGQPDYKKLDVSNIAMLDGYNLAVTEVVSVLEKKRATLQGGEK